MPLAGLESHLGPETFSSHSRNIDSLTMTTTTCMVVPTATPPRAGLVRWVFADDPDKAHLQYKLHAVLVIYCTGLKGEDFPVAYKFKKLQEKTPCLFSFMLLGSSGPVPENQS